MLVLYTQRKSFFRQGRVSARNQEEALIKRNKLVGTQDISASTRGQGI